jgi:hypothetical protein
MQITSQLIISLILSSLAASLLCHVLIIAHARWKDDSITLNDYSVLFTIRKRALLICMIPFVNVLFLLIILFICIYCLWCNLVTYIVHEILD